MHFNRYVFRQSEHLNGEFSCKELLKDKIQNREAGIVLYGMTPPKENTDIEKVREIASKHMSRIQSLDIDGVVLYDICHDNYVRYVKKM